MSIDTKGAPVVPRKRNTNILRSGVRMSILAGGAIALIAGGLLKRELEGFVILLLSVVLVLPMPGRDYYIYQWPIKAYEGWRRRNPRRTFSRIGDAFASDDAREAYERTRGSAWVNAIPVSSGGGQWLAELTNGQESTTILQIVSTPDLVSGTEATRAQADLRLVSVLKRLSRKLAVSGRERVALFTLYMPADFTEQLDYVIEREFQPEEDSEAEAILLLEGRAADAVVFDGAFDPIQGVAITTPRSRRFARKVDEESITDEDLMDNRAIQLLDQLQRRLTANHFEVRIPSFLDVVTWVKNLFEPMAAHETYDLRSRDLEDLESFDSIRRSRLVQSGLTPLEGELTRKYARLGDSFVATMYAARFPTEELLLGALDSLYQAPITVPHGISIVYGVRERSRESFLITLKRRFWDAWLNKRGSVSASESVRYEGMEMEDWEHTLSRSRTTELELRTFVAAASEVELLEQMAEFEDIFEDEGVVLQKAVGRQVHVRALWKFLGVNAARL